MSHRRFPRRPSRPKVCVWIALGVCLGLGGACLVAPNPDFMDPGETDGISGADGVSGSGNGDGCPAGTPDCDEQPDCDDPPTCGGCTPTCELPGYAPTCVDGRCVLSIELPIVDDAHLDAEQPQQNFGDSATLILDATHDVLIGLPNLGDLPGPGEIESITLQLTVITAGAAIELHRVEGPWTEDTVTQANAPAIDGAVLATWTPTPGANTIELLGLFGAWRLGSPEHSLGLVPSATSPDPATTVLVSSEGLSPPVIVVTLSW
jgi:hypothetical protein